MSPEILWRFQHGHGQKYHRNDDNYQTETDMSSKEGMDEVLDIFTGEKQKYSGRAEKYVSYANLFVNINNVLPN